MLKQTFLELVVLHVSAVSTADLQSDRAGIAVFEFWVVVFHFINLHKYFSLFLCLLTFGFVQ